MICNWELYMGTFLSLQLEQEYNITIPRSDAKKLKTVEDTVDYIERREHRVKRKVMAGEFGSGHRHGPRRRLRRRRNHRHRNPRRNRRRPASHTGHYLAAVLTQK